MSADIILEGRQISMKGPLPEKEMQFIRAQVDECLSQPTTIEVEFLSTKIDTDLTKVVGRGIAIEMEAPDDKKRYFHGNCVEAEYVGIYKDHVFFRATLKPWFWFLTRTSDCRVFQDMSVTDIIKKIFADHGFSDYEVKTKQTFDKRVYCVQYRETDFDFLCRLMEEEGIYYFFEYEKTKHKLILVDEMSAHQSIEGVSDLEFHEREENYRRRDDHIFEWRGHEAVHTGKVTLNDYNFEKPSTDLKASKTIAKTKHDHSDMEVYDFLGHNKESSVGDRFARVRMEAYAAARQRPRGIANVRQLTVGGKFKMKGHQRKEENQEYLVVSARHQLTIETEYEEENVLAEMLGATLDFKMGDKIDTYRCVFETISTEETYRAPIVTPWPKISGIQTALVVGKSGEEIWTDKYGRVKVQFYWDREGKKDENSSCWIRTAVPWSGKKWGMFAVPRIGQEVVVQFEEGDPDRPVITGMMYNEETKHPYDLPANQTQHGVKTNKSKKGGGFSELIFEDKADSEFVRLQSERDYTEIIKNDADIKIGYDHQDKGDYKLDIYNDRTEIVDQGDYKRTLNTGSETVDVAKDRTVKVGGDMKTDVSGKWTIDVGTEINMKAGSKIVLTVGSNKITMDMASVKIEATQIEATAQATLKMSGSAMAELTSNGMLTLGASGMVELSSDGMTTVGGSMVDVSGDAMLMLGGGMMMIN